MGLDLVRWFCGIYMMGCLSARSSFCWPHQLIQFVLLQSPSYSRQSVFAIVFVVTHNAECFGDFHEGSLRR